MTRPRTPQTNGRVERFNGRIADILKTHHFMSGEDLEQTLLRYCLLDNEHLPQAALNSKTPMDTMNMWYASHPQIFLYPPRSNRPGCDNYLNVNDFLVLFTTSAYAIALVTTLDAIDKNFLDCKKRYCNERTHHSREKHAKDTEIQSGRADFMVSSISPIIKKPPRQEERKKKWNQK
jgi:transposase InsO family protein